MSKFRNKYLNECRWSKDNRKRYNQCEHFLLNNRKYDIDLTDMLFLQDMKKEAYKKMKK